MVLDKQECYRGAGKPNSVFLLGAYPPPIGGISVHVMRLAEFLQNRYDVTVLDFYGGSAGSEGQSAPTYVVRVRSARLGKILRQAVRLAACAKIIHLHTTSLRRASVVAALILIGCGKKIIVTIHGGECADDLRTMSKLRRFVLKTLVTQVDKVIVVSTGQELALRELGIPRSRLIVIPAYIPGRSEPTNELAETVAALRARVDRIVVSSGYGIRLYGYDVIVRALMGNPEGLKTAVILAVYTEYDEAYLRWLKELEYCGEGVEVVILRGTSPGGFSYLLSQADVYIRATSQDGDAVAVREALQHGMRVICSDCTNRPNGVTLFRTGDAESLSGQLRQISRKHGSDEADSWIYANDVAAVYEELLRKL